MSAPVRFARIRDAVLPQPDARRNGITVRPHWQRWTQTGVPSQASRGLLTGLLMGISLPALGLDWRFDPQRDAASVPPTTTAEAVPTTPYSMPSPVVLPPASWPDEPQDSGNDAGWQWLEPSIGTGSRIQNLDETRSAVQIAESEQEASLSGQAVLPSSLGNLPDALNQNYRIDFGIEYRF